MTKKEFCRMLTAAQNQKRAQHDREIRELIKCNRAREQDYNDFKFYAIESTKKRCGSW